jgi:hypothetical protein
MGGEVSAGHGSHLGSLEDLRAVYEAKMKETGRVLRSADRSPCQKADRIFNGLRPGSP